MNDYPRLDETGLTHLVDELSEKIKANENVQSDWNISDSTSDAYIKNKPSIFNPNSLSSSSNTPTDSETLITKESGNWVVKTFSKVWDYIKGKIGISSSGSASKYLNEQGTFSVPPDNNTTYSLSVDGNNIKLTPSSGSANTITVPYATTAGSATDSSKVAKSGDTMSGRLTANGHISIPTNGGSFISQKDTSKAAIQITKDAVTDGSRYDAIIAGKSTDGSTWDIGIINNTIYIGRYASNQTANTHSACTLIPLTSSANVGEAIKNITRSGTTFTATRANGNTFTFTQQDTNTWRGIQDNLTSSSTTDSLSANQGKVLNDNKAEKSEAIKSISRSGTTFTVTRCDNTTFTFTQQDNNTTYSAGTGLSLSGTTFSQTAWKSLSLPSTTSISSFSSVTLYSGNTTLKNASEVLVTFDGPRIKAIRLPAIGKAVKGLSTYSENSTVGNTSTWTLTVGVDYNSSNGILTLGCYCNTWGFSTVPVKVDGVYYR